VLSLNLREVQIVRQWMLKQMALLVAGILVATASWGAGLNGDASRYRKYTFEISGPDLETVKVQAALHAVRSAVGEFYCSDEMLLARSLLDRYLQRHYRRFIPSQKVLSRRESQGIVYLRMSVIVDIRALEDDLRQKRFFYKPKSRPFFYVCLAETVNGTPTAGEPVAREEIHDVLERLFAEKRYEPRVIYPVRTGASADEQTANVNLTGDPVRLREAREAAQRAGVEVLLTGRIELTRSSQRPMHFDGKFDYEGSKPETKEIHFDEFTFYDALTTLTLIRVDDGQVMAEGSFKATAGNTDPEAAKSEAAYRAAAKVLERLIPRFTERWERTMTDNVEFQVMVTGVTPDEAGVIQQRLATRLEGVEVYRRSLFEDVLVLNVFYAPDRMQPDERARVEQVLRDMTAPQLKILPAPRRQQVFAERVS
jgi:hypothetical protein